LDGLKKGWTPNPDVLCNREIKFGNFLEHALKLGADYVATGHYCQVINDCLYKAADTTKDQSYFLCALTRDQLQKVIFPLAGIKKTEVRRIAKELNLINSSKKDSTGICFIGEKKIKDFLKTYLGAKTGEIHTLDDKIVGKNDGLMYYTIGQRKGLKIGGINSNTKRWFVIRKDVKNNILYVSNGDCQELYSKRILLENFNFLQEHSNTTTQIHKQNAPKNTTAKIPETEFDEISCAAKIRYRQPDQKCTAKNLGDGKVEVIFAEKQRAVTLGQWCVLYNDGGKCLGGGIIYDILSHGTSKNADK
jgi:tRNA-specific 2-thiouridylase